MPTLTSVIDTNIPDSLGSAGHVLTVNSGGSAAEWAAAGGGASAYTREAKTANYTAVAGDLGKILDFTANSSTLSLTAAATLGAGWYIWVKNSSSNAAHIVTIDANGSETIDGVVTRPMYRMESKQIVCDGSNFITIDGGVFGLAMNMDIPSVTYQPKPTGDNAIALGPYNYATGSYSFAAGYASTASGTQSTAIGFSADATAQESTAIGTQSRAEGNGSIGLGYNSYATGGQSIAGPDSRASGGDSVAFGIGSNSSSYGASGANSVALGSGLARATGARSIAIANNAAASGADSVAIGRSVESTASAAFTFGYHCIASAANTIATGLQASAAIIGKSAYASGSFAGTNNGDAQGGQYILRSDTTDATAEAMTTNKSTAAANNQIVAGSDTCIMFSGTIVAMQNGAQDQGGWQINGLLKNDGGTTTLVNSEVRTFADGNGWSIVLSADNTNNALKVQCTGEASHNIRWVANIQTSEVTYA